MVIRGSLLVCLVGPEKLAGLQGRMWERHRQELLMKLSREEKDAGWRERPQCEGRIGVAILWCCTGESLKQVLRLVLCFSCWTFKY